jgi:hypothetical protein
MRSILFLFALLLIMVSHTTAYLYLSPNFVVNVIQRQDEVILIHYSVTKDGYSFVEVGANETLKNSYLFYQSPIVISTALPNITDNILWDSRFAYRQMLTLIYLNATKMIPYLNNDTIWLRFGSNSATNPSLTDVRNGVLPFDFLVNVTETYQFNLSSMNITSIVTPEPPFLNRIEYVFLPWAIIACIPYLLYIFLTVLFSRQQPLKARGLWPTFGSLLLLIHYGVGLIPSYILNYSQIYNASCYLVNLGQHPFSLSTVAFFIIHYWRYLTLFHLSIQKEFWYKSDVEQRIPFHFRLMKFLGTYLGQAIVLAIVFSVQFVWMLIWILSSQCNSFYVTIGLALSVLACIVTSACGIVYDFILSFMYIRKHGIMSYITMDAFYFRVEFIAGPIFIVPLIVTGQILSFTRFVGNDPTQARYYDIIIISVTNSLAFGGMFVTSCGFVVTLTVFNWLRRLCMGKADKPEIIERILEDSEGSSLFLEFSKSGMIRSYSFLEYSPENYWCRASIKEYKRNPTLEMAKKIYMTYFNGSNSELECNVQGSSTMSVKKILDVGEFPANLYDDLCKEVMTNICDTFTRFRASGKFKNYEKKRRFFSDLQKE